jgi:benzoate-CoA ligase family protein
MRDHTVHIDRSVSPARIEYAPVFNVAVPFIDRHLDEGRADKVAIRADAGDVTYRALAENVNRCGNALLGLGLAPGDRVLMVVKDCAEFFYAFWGAIKAGLVPAPLNTLLRAHDYAYMLDCSGAAAVLYSPEFAAEVEPALQKASHKPGHVLRVDGEGDTLARRIAASSPTLEPAPATADDDCFWLFSSGSTGLPKAAVHAQRDMVVTSQHYGADVLGVREDDICFSAAKLFFAYGLGNAMTFPLWAGAQAVLFPARPTPDAMFDMIARYRPTIFYGVPTLYAAQLQALDKAAPDLSSVRVCVSAGEPLPADILRRWKAKTGLDILDGIGTTEILHIFISNCPDDVRAGTSGRLVPGYEARIVDDGGRDVAPGETGNLRIKGGSTLKYYWENLERTAETIIDGWVHTGDTYYQDADGYYVCCGRSDDMLKVGGIWCSPVEIEARLIEHPKVLEAAVVGRPDADELIKPEAHVVLKSAEDLGEGLAAELLEHCKSGLAPYKYPRWFNFVTELPKTATGKIQRYKLRAVPPG